MLVTINQAQFILQRGGVIAFPNDTVYSLGALANNPVAIERLYTCADRDRELPLVCYCADLDQLRSVAGSAFEASHQIIESTLQFPLSLVFPCLANQRVLSQGRDYIIVQIVRHPLMKAMLRATGPILGIPASAKCARRITSARMAERHLFDSVDGVLDGGNCTHGCEASVIDLRNPMNPVMVHSGVVTSRTLQEHLPQFLFEEMEEDSLMLAVKKDSTCRNILKIHTVQELVENCNQTSVLLACAEDIESFPAIDIDCYVVNIGSRHRPKRALADLYANLEEAEAAPAQKLFYLAARWDSVREGWALERRLDDICSHQKIA